jgi:hypothetical protein
MKATIPSLEKTLIYPAQPQFMEKIANFFR